MRKAFVAALLIACAVPAVVEAAAPGACSSVAARAGKRITDQMQLMGLGISGSKVALHETDNKGALHYAEPQWCKEGEFSAGGRQFVLWHNTAIAGANLSGPFDRVVKAGDDPQSGKAAVVYSLADRLAPVLGKADPAAPAVVYHIMLEMQDEIWIVGSYDRPPPPEELARFAAGGAVPINVRIDKKTRKITLYAPT